MPARVRAGAAPWWPYVRVVRDENEGSSYGLFTLCTTIVGALSVLIAQQADTRGAAVWFAIQATLAYAVNLLGIGALFWREWVQQEVELWPTAPESRLFGRRVPWRVVRALDHYVAINVAFSLLFMTFWVWDSSPDKDYYFALPDTLPRQNAWAVWSVFLGTAFALWNGVGFREFLLRRVSVIFVGTVHIFFALPTLLLVFGVVVSEAQQRQTDDERRQEVVRTEVQRLQAERQQEQQPLSTFCTE